MKKIVTLIFCSFLVLCAKAQVALEQVLQPGSQLIYEVDANGSKYNFIVTIKDLEGLSFDWEMTAPVNKKGTINHTKTALAGATLMYNMFQAGTKTLDNKTLSVWLSQKVYQFLTTKTGQPVKIGMYGTEKPPMNMGTYTAQLSTLVMIDGEEVSLPEELVKELVKEGKDYIPGAGDEFFTFYPSPKLPIILRMNAGFTISLKSVKTKAY